jgi:rod shape-determining protein MreD
MRQLIAFVTLWLALILDSTLFQIPPISTIQPNLVLIVLMMIGVLYGPRTTLVYGVAIGLLQDLDYGRFLGLEAFTYGLIAYCAASIFHQFLHRSLALTFFLTICFTFVQQWLTYGLTRLFDVTAYQVQAVLRHTLFEMMINGVFLLLLYPFLIRLLEQRSKRRYKGVDSESL